MAKAKKLPSGKWNVQTQITADGKTIRKSFTARTKREAEYLASQWKYNSVGYTKGGKTFGQAVDEYIKSRSNIFSPSTILGYQKIRNKYLGELWDECIDERGVERLQSIYNELSVNLSSKTLRNIHSLINASCSKYSDNLKDIVLPQETKQEIKIPTDNEVLLMLQTNDVDLRKAIALAALAGLRESEILALKYDDIKDNYININKAVVTGLNGKQIKHPKSLAGYRKIPISNTLLEIIGVGKGNVVPLTHGSIARRYDTLQRRLGIGHYRFHDLRHYYASTLLAIGMPDKYAMELMGHSSADMLKKVYQHTMADKKANLYESLMQHQNTLKTQTKTQTDT